MKEGFGFVRGKVFEGLENYLKAEPIEVKNRRLQYPIQETLPGMGFDYSYGVRVRSGKFFEILSQGIYGGRFKIPQEVNGEVERDLFSEPDLVHTDSPRYIFREVKSFSIRNALKLFDAQMNKYARIQFDEDDQIQVPPTIRFELFRHGINKLNEYGKKDVHFLLRDLSHSVRFMISVPFSVTYAIYDNASVPNEDGAHQYPFTSRHEIEDSNYSWCTQFRPPGINNLLAYPEETFYKLDLNPDNFNFTSRRFPRDVRLNDFHISPFPILIIGEKDPDRESLKLEERVNARRKRMDERYPWYASVFCDIAGYKEPLLELDDDTYEKDEIPF